LAVFRLLRAYTSRPVAAWAITIVIFLSVPLTAFAYQYYPEAPAGLAIALLASYALYSADVRRLPAFAYGLMAGGLPWLHLRFMPLAAGTFVAVALSRRRDRAAVGWVGGGV